MSDIIEFSEYPSVAINDAFHSFNLGDEFISSDITDLALNALSTTPVKLTWRQMSKKVTSFIQHHKKEEYGEITVGNKKRKATINGRTTMFKVYVKSRDLSAYKRCMIKGIPKQYRTFCKIWNDECEYLEEFTAIEFRSLVESFNIYEAYRSQIAKFLWLIGNRGLCTVKCGRHEQENVYVKEGNIPIWLLNLVGAKFHQKRIGPYMNRMHLLKRKP